MSVLKLLFVSYFLTLQLSGHTRNNFIGKLPFFCILLQSVTLAAKVTLIGSPASVFAEMTPLDSLYALRRFVGKKPGNRFPLDT